MNYTDEQIRLAGFVQPDEGPRDFNSVLDLQGEGTRVLDQYIAEVEAEEGDCCADLGIAESTIGALVTENDDLQAENGELQEDLEDAADKIETQNQVLADYLGVDFAWTAFIEGNTADTYPPGHSDYGKYWSTAFVMTANIIDDGGALSYTTSRHVTGPLSSAPWETETNGRSTSSTIRPLVGGVPQTVVFTTKPYFSNKYYPKFYGTPGTVVWEYDGS